jgi:hypothetical protein
MTHDEDPISVGPDIDGPHARAWLIDFRQTKPHSGVAGWLVEAPFAHPLWHSYRISLIHLREVPGLPAAHISLPGATHEMAVYALLPDAPREGILKGGPSPILRPTNFAAQFIEASDADAAERVGRAVDLICQGKLSPDTDFIHQWVVLFGDSLMLDRSYKKSDQG